jgi:hypothetical protein
VNYFVPKIFFGQYDTFKLYSIKFNKKINFHLQSLLVVVGSVEKTKNFQPKARLQNPKKNPSNESISCAIRERGLVDP